MYYEIFSIIAPVFICALIGYSWVKLSQPFEIQFVTRLIFNISAPCLVFATFMELEANLNAIFELMLVAFICALVSGLIALILFSILKIDLNAFLPSQMFPNTGNMGLPLCMLAFGEEGLAMGISFFTVNAFLQFTVGMSIYSGQVSFKNLFRNPMFASVIITLILVFSGIPAPRWLLNTTDLLAGTTIPLMLIALGVSLAQFKITSLKLSLSLSVLRLGMGFLVGLLISNLFGLEGAARGAVIIQSSMPIAVFSYLFATQYKRRPEEVAGTVVLSTMLSFLSLPLLLLFVLP